MYLPGPARIGATGESRPESRRKARLPSQPYHSLRAVIPIMLKLFIAFLFFGLALYQCDAGFPQEGGRTVTLTGGSYAGTRCDDTINIISGSNTVTTSTGGDYIILSAKPSTVDTIVDFDDREDLLDISALVASGTVDFNDLDIVQETVEGLPIVRINFPGNQQLRLENFLVNELNENFFIF